MRNETKLANDVVPSGEGKVAIVTGANSGIGFEIARALTRKSYTVIVAARDKARGEKAVEKLRSEFPDGSVHLGMLDLADLDSIADFASHSIREFPTIEYLFNNAGIMALPYAQTRQGFELQFGVNHIGTFALTLGLMPALVAAGNARIVTTSSILHSSGTMDLQRNVSAAGYDTAQAYSRSKLANLLFTYELDRRLKKLGSPLLSVACHPGYAATNLQLQGPRISKSRTRLVLSLAINGLLAQSAESGALSALYAAFNGGLKGAEYIGPTKMFGLRGAPGITRSSELSYDKIAAEQLWQLSEELTGLKLSL